MKKIEINRANWKSDELFLEKPMNITTLVIEQGKTIIDPSDADFLSALIKEYVKNHGNKKTITLKLSLVEAFYYGENANVYMLKGALEILCQSGSISNTQGLKDGNTDRHRDNITAHT